MATFTITAYDTLLIVYIGVGLGIFVILLYIIGILRNIHKISKTAKNTINVVNETILKPLQISQKVFKKVEEVLNPKKPSNK